MILNGLVCNTHLDNFEHISSPVSLCSMQYYSHHPYPLTLILASDRKYGWKGCFHCVDNPIYQLERMVVGFCGCLKGGEKISSQSE
jgi:hypothetical protein